MHELSIFIMMCSCKIEHFGICNKALLVCWVYEGNLRGENAEIYYNSNEVPNICAIVSFLIEWKISKPQKRNLYIKIFLIYTKYLVHLFRMLLYPPEPP